MLLLLLTTAVGLPRSYAQACANETEPNDDIPDGNALAGCVTGSLSEEDGQDIFLFNVSDSADLYTLSLQGLPEGLTNAQLMSYTQNDAGQTTGTSELLELPVFDGESAETQPFQLIPGDYLIGISTAGNTGGDYQLTLTTATSTGAPETEPNDERETAQPLTDTILATRGDDEDYFRWSLAEDGQRWQITLQAPLNSNFALDLENSDGQRIAAVSADNTGRAILTDLGLPIGDYILRTRGGAVGEAYSVQISALGAQLPTQESEPNDSRDTANLWDSAQPFTGRIAGGSNYDYVRFAISEAESATKFDLGLASESADNFRVCLQDADGNSLQCRDAARAITLPDLQLPSGDYILEIRGTTDPDNDYTLSKTNQLVSVHAEFEPNDEYRMATPFGQERAVTGRFVGNEWDIYKVTTTGGTQMWRFQTLGEGVTDLRYLDSSGTIIQSTNNQRERRTRLPHLLLVPGEHYIALRGTDSDYTLLAVPLGAPPADFENESNDSEARANELLLNGQRQGIVYDDRDDDYYFFELTAPTNVRITVEQGDFSNMRLVLDREEQEIVRLRSDEAGETLEFVSRLQEGSYSVFMDDQGGGSADLYTVRLEELDPFLPLTDIEPNNSIATANAIPSTLVVDGRVSSADFDYYQLPDLPNSTNLTVTTDADVELRLYDAEGDRTDYTYQDGVLTTDEPLAAGQAYYLYVSGRSTPYTVELEFTDGVEPLPLPAPLDGSISLTLPDDPVAAFWFSDQVVIGTLTNDSAETLTLDITTGDPLALSVLAASELAAGESVDIAVRIAADTRPDSYTINLRGTSAENQFVTAQASVDVSAAGAVVNPSPIQPLPDALLGNFNAALLTFGAEITTENPDYAEEQILLHDGYAPLGDGFRETGISEWPIVLGIDLAGDAALPIVGFALNPQSADNALTKPHEFEIWLSADGEDYELALADTLANRPIEQPFVLPEPIAATHAQLHILSTHNGGNVLNFGEWKVITTDAPTERIDIAAFKHGGHVVDVQPNGDASVARSLLDPTDAVTRLRPLVGDSAEIVIGFHHDRAAQIEQIDWVRDPDAGNPFTTITVSISTAGPAGPWRTVGVFDGATENWQLPDSTWARFVRFTSTPQQDRTWRDLPNVIHIWERANDDEYRSITNEWGHYQPSAIYERLNPVLQSAETVAADDNDTPETATPLPPGTTLPNNVQIGVDEDWFRIDIPDGQNAAVISLNGSPSVDVAVEVQDANGQPLPLTSDNSNPMQRVVTATLPAGTTTVYARVSEPPRSIVFAWDNSGSVAPYYSAIYRALTRFAEDVTAGEEEVHLLPFGRSSPLSENWLDTPEAVQTTLTNYPRSDSSSNAEGAMVVATDLLAFREGTRAIVVITDAESGYQPTTEMWRGFRAVQPRIFSLHVHSNVDLGTRPADYQDKMQSWADVNVGFYDWLRTTRELENGFARAATWLRRPKGYAISADTAQVAPPGPGTLQLLSSATGENAVASADLLGNTAVELIIDASGSMQQPLAGSTRIQVAKDVLDDITANVLPDGVPVALRAFGNREGNFSCRTDLEVPLAPLDRDGLRATIAAIEPQTNANTAIAASLAQVANDLASATGPKIIILLTDGEETCDGDPAATIAALREQGVDVRVNIVGFAIDDEALKATFAEWAQIGGGSYFDATSAEELSASLTQALRVSYRVLDVDGNVVGTGLVDGDPLELPAGTYTVVLETEGEPSYEVVVGGDEDVILRVQAE